MPTIEINVQCRVCRWKGTSYSSSSKILCEACGCECDKIQQKVSSQESVNDEWPKIQKRRVSKCILKVRKKILEIATIIVGEFQYKYSGMTMNDSEIKRRQSTFLSVIEGMLISGDFDKFINPIAGYKPSDVISTLVQTAGDKCDLVCVNPVYYSHSNSIHNMIQSYVNYCTDPTVIDED